MEKKISRCQVQIGGRPVRGIDRKILCVSGTLLRDDEGLNRDGGEKRIIGLETKEEFSLIRFSSSAPILPSSLSQKASAKFV